MIVMCSATVGIMFPQIGTALSFFLRLKYIRFLTNTWHVHIYVYIRNNVFTCKCTPEYDHNLWLYIYATV